MVKFALVTESGNPKLATTPMETSSMLLVVMAPLLLTGWVAAWLNWCFNGEIRHAIVAAFPEKWRNGVSRGDILDMDHDGLLVYLCAQSLAPEFLNRLLCCPACLSAYISAAGMLILLFVVPLLMWPLLPLIWAAAAYAGLTLFRHLSQK